MFQFDLLKFKDNYNRIIESIKNRCSVINRSFSELTIITVTKYVDAAAVKQIINYGITNIGENRVQRIRELRENINDNNINWNMIGTLQSNKIKYIAGYINLIHSVNSIKLVQEINRHAIIHNRIIDILVEINVSDENTKTGADTETSKQIFDHYCVNKSSLTNVNICGLMTMAPETSDEKIIRKTFSDLRNLKNTLNSEFGLHMEYMSMGMSNDYIFAIEEGATHLRIGSAFFLS
ncbi:YggS family pyridoxal phosphate-dependent enzyme [Candidatus Dependentiae bacterium]|nr:YggS family pyridoxal phosphate-dependent enzyme [Candidatus Dependentiae bacterium]